VACAPGRVNLIGEHTDPSGGLALPFATTLGVTVTARRIAGDAVHVHAADLGERDAFGADDLAPGAVGGWRALVRGVVAELARNGVDLRGVALTIEGDLPRGAGLASSAAVGVGLVLALSALRGGGDPDPLAAARLLQRVEHRWLGAQTGLLDQLASLCARQGEALRIDFDDLTLRPVPLDLGAWTLALVDSGAPRELAGSGYNTRRRECEEAAAMLGVPSLRHAPPAAIARLPEPHARRARHVLTECARVDAAVAALAARDMPALAALLDASHLSLRDDLEVSVPAVEATRHRILAAGAAGARIHGGGFGGAVLALFPPRCPLPEDALPVTPGPGARVS